MSDQPIYLFKGARRPLYRKENLHILAEERGAVVEVGWNRSWVAPEFFDDGVIARGRPVIFVFTDRPYEHFVPVRAGEVVRAEWDDLTLRLRVSLRNHVGLEDMEVSHFTRLVKGAVPGLCPGHKFVGPKRDGVELVNYYDEREEDGWRRVVDQVLAMSGASEDDPYRRSVFFRPLGLKVGDASRTRARGVPLEPGERAILDLGFHNPHLDDDFLAGHHLRLLAAGDALRATAPDVVPRDGIVEVGIEPLGPDPELTIQIGPAGGNHTHVVERFRVRRDGADEEAGHESLAHGAADAARRREELMSLYDFVLRNCQFGPGDIVDFFERFAGLLPDQQRIREDWALHQYREGEAAEALRILEGLDPERMGSDDARFALFRLRVATDDEHSGHGIAALGLTDEGRFPRLLEELQDLPARTLGRIVPPLVEALPADQVMELMDRVGDRIRSPGALAHTALALYDVTENADWACAWLLGRYRDLHLADPSVEETIMDLAVERSIQEDDPDLDRIAGHRIAYLVERGDVQAARHQLTSARRVLNAGERRRLYHRVAERLARTGRHDEAAEVMVELAWAELDDGQVGDALEAATEAAARARGLHARTGDDRPQWLLECLTAVTDAWADLVPLQEWRTSEEERRRALLHKRYLNRRILIAGGQRNEEWVAHLHDLTGASVDWCRACRDETDDLEAYARRLENGHYHLVVHYLQKTGHGTAEVLRPAAEKGGAAWVDARSAGRRGVVEAVWASSQVDSGVAAGSSR
jgi:hypothetical protein